MPLLLSLLLLLLLLSLRDRGVSTRPGSGRGGPLVRCSLSRGPCALVVAIRGAALRSSRGLSLPPVARARLSFVPAALLWMVAGDGNEQPLVVNKGLARLFAVDGGRPVPSIGPEPLPECHFLVPMSLEIRAAPRGGGRSSRVPLLVGREFPLLARGLDPAHDLFISSAGPALSARRPAFEDKKDDVKRLIA